MFIIRDGTITVSIVGDASVQFGPQSTAYTVTEGDGDVKLTLVRSGDINRDITITVTPEVGSAARKCSTKFRVI